MNSNLLKIQNPWWENPSMIEEDVQLKVLKHSAYAERPELHSLTFKPRHFHILRGARQVGKTTLLKQWIRNLLIEEKIPPKSILFLSCEGIENFRELQETLALWLNEKKQEMVYLFLDEISFVEEWQRAILWLINTGLLEKASLMVTGSNARDLKESSERFPGRRGHGLDLALHPFDLTDYERIKCFQGKSADELLEIFLTTGGFPHAIRDWAEWGYVTDETYSTYKNWILGDALRFKLAEETLKHIFFRIAETLTSRLTWPLLIEETPVRSHETALQYVEHLEEAFLCHLHYCYDPVKKGPAFQKARKIYLIDPILYHLAYAWKKNIVNIAQWAKDFVTNSENRGKLLENFYVVGTSRKVSPIFYWYSTKEKKEVDLVIPQKEKVKLYEVKWKESLSSFNALQQKVEILDASQLMGFLKNFTKK